MKRIISAFVLFALVFAVFGTAASAQEGYDINSVVSDTADYIYKTVREPQFGSVGGEWAVLGLARSGEDIPSEYFENYYRTIERHVSSCGGVLHERKYTEYSRLIVALTSIGKNPQDVGGFNLLSALSDYNKTIWQGVNGAIWALIALDCGNYEIPVNPDAEVVATRQMYIEHILQKQTSDGGWALTGDKADADITGMALQALSKYRDNEAVNDAIQRALCCLSDMQNDMGGFSAYSTENSESTVQVAVALCALGIGADDERFVKNGKSVVDSLFSFYCGAGAFRHIRTGEINLMATEQCFYALVALKRVDENKNTLYNMSDVDLADFVSDATGLVDKNGDVQKMNIINPDRTFADIASCEYKDAIEELASRGIINGKAENIFEPDSQMTRAEFATIVSKSLGLCPKGQNVFGDVSESDWFFDYVGTAYTYGIIKGVSDDSFNPSGTITRQEAAVMVARAAKLCGMHTEMQTVAVRDVLAQFSDYVKASDWSKEALAFCYDKGILSDSVMDIEPAEAVTRGEIASMLFNMLSLANLL